MGHAEQLVPRRVGRAVPWLAAALLVARCGDEETPTPPESDAPVAVPVGPPLFVDQTAAWGLPVEPLTFADGTYQLREMMGPGVGVFDADDDGRPDLIEPRAPAPDAWGSPSPNRFWQQQEDGRFVDATTISGLGDPGVGLALAIGDADQDGDRDVYFANFGPDAFYVNDGQGRFTARTTDAEFDSAEWTCAASFFDHERDGDLDLFLVHYVVHDEARRCYGGQGALEYCGPLEYEPVVDALWRNDGDGTFTNVAADVGIHLPGTGLGVVCTDLTDDGLMDVYVANDAMANHLWVGQPDHTYLEEGYLRGVALNRHGKPEASMGVTAGDSDGDGTLDLFMTHLEGENNTLYRSGTQGYRDRSVQAQLSQYDLARTGFGCAFLDADLDGDLDLAVVNGRVKRASPLPGAPLTTFWNDYAEPNQFFLNVDGTYEDASARTGRFGSVPEVGRGLAIADLDGDGQLDLVVSSYASPLRILRGVGAMDGHHWLQVRAVTRGRDALGAQVTAHLGDRTMRRLCLASSSYASSHQPWAHFGLGPSTDVAALEVLWPDGTRERFPGPAVDQVVTLTQGDGSRP